jgi:hypothetical protein
MLRLIFQIFVSVIEILVVLAAIFAHWAEQKNRPPPVTVTGEFACTLAIPNSKILFFFRALIDLRGNNENWKMKEMVTKKKNMKVGKQHLLMMLFSIGFMI